MRATRYAAVVIDVDSTLSRIEGIEWLAGQCDEAIRQRISETTDAAMRGDIPLERVYGERLSLVRPTRASVAALGDAYIEAIAPGARETIATLREAGVRVALVSGGLLDAILPLAAYVGISANDVRAVAMRFDAAGQYIDYDRESPVARRGGKPIAVESLSLPNPLLAVGDGITDAELKGIAETFVAFTGVVRHERVVQAADAVVTRFDELLPLVMES